MVLTHNANRLKSTPASWADFWDIKKLPGKCGLRKDAKYIPEFTLMADDMVPKDVHGVPATREDQDCTLEKLDEIKSSIRWWETGA